MRKAILFLAFFAAAFSVFSQPLDTVRLSSYFDSLASTGRFMGSVAVSRDGEVLFAKAVGLADVEKGLRAGVESRYRIGSISKSFTAVLILQAVEEGRLSLSGTLDKFFPQVPNASKITIEMLLRHQSGVNDFPNSGKAPAGWRYELKTREQVIGMIVASGSDFEPGTQTSYSNPGYMLLTFIAEDVFGKSFAALIDERIVIPLGMQHTHTGGEVRAVDCLPYNFSPRGWVAVQPTNMINPTGAGGVISTPADICIFAEGLYGGKLLKPESFRAMEDFSAGSGMGLVRMPYRNVPGRGHGGKVDTFVSQYAFYPSVGLSFAVTSNGIDGKIGEVVRGALDVIFQNLE